MHIKSLRLTNIRCFEKLTWELKGLANLAGWHVVLGDNGTGKSTFLKAASLATMGEIVTGLIDYKQFVRSQAQSAEIDVDVTRDLISDTVFAGIVDQSFISYSSTVQIGIGPTHPTLGISPAAGQNFENWRSALLDRDTGWFTAAYGPFRRFSGGDVDLTKRFSSFRHPSRHLTLFFEGVALSDSIEWLQRLQFEKLEGTRSDIEVDTVVRFLNQPGFLPNNVKLDKITSAAVEFVDARGTRVAIEDLSDGYRSILSMTIDLLRQLASAYSGIEVFEAGLGSLYAVMPGIVLIDEVDAHLHPTWQRQIGPWFRKHFPNIQFIVTTHSPLVCQAAADGGSVFKLPTPGTDEVGRFLEGTELDRLLYGDILDAYSTEVFGSGITRSDKARGMQDRLAELNVKSLSSKLSIREIEERGRLQGIFGSSSSVLPSNGT